MALPFTQLARNLFSLYNLDGTARQPGAGLVRWGAEVEAMLTALGAEALDIEFPYGFINAENTGAGTPNAIIATTDRAVPTADGGALIALPIAETNDATPVTVAFNGGAALTIKSSSGSDMAIGGLVAGMIVAGYVSAGTFRLLSDQTSAAVLAAAEAAQAAAEQAAVDAEAAAASVNLPIIQAGDAAKVLSVNPAEDGYILGPVNDLSITLTDASAEPFPLVYYAGQTLMPWQFKDAGDPDDTLSIQRMLAALDARTTRRHCRIPQQGYAISGAIVQPAGSVVEAAGAEFICANGGATALQWWAISGSKSALLGPRFTGAYTGYKSGDRAVAVSGVANGAGVAPTYIEDVVLDIWGVENFAEGAIRAAYVQGLEVDLRRAYNLGYFGLMGLSVHDAKVRLNVESVLGAAATSWNAYGIALTADTSSVDLVRYPPSSNCDVSGKIKSIPEWHGADTHGGKFIKFHNMDIIDCRRGIILTTLSTAGGEAEDCIIEGNRIKNTLTGANAVSGSNKNDGAMWDVGVDTTNRNKRNTIKDNKIWGHGSPTIALGAFTSQYCDDGVYEGNIFQRPYYAGISVRGGNNRLTIRDNTVIDAHTGAGHASAFPVGIRLEAANWHDVSLVENTIIAQDDTIDTNVAEIGILIDATSNRTVYCAGNAIHPDVTTPWSVGAGTGMSGELFGSVVYDPPSLADGAGVTTTVTVTGALAGDLAEVSFSTPLQGIQLTAEVSAANTVSVRFQNETGGVLDLANGTLRAKIRKAY